MPLDKDNLNNPSSKAFVRPDKRLKAMVNRSKTKNTKALSSTMTFGN